MERFINGFLDLITIWFLSRFGKDPCIIWRYGLLMFIIGLPSQRLHWYSKIIMYNNMRYSLVSDNPWFYIA
jgi:hypothetical protein